MSSPLDPRQTFETFVEGPSNALARAAALKFCAAGAPAFNPLYIYGGVGMGKTHLLQAIAAKTRAENVGLRVAYMSAERFMFHFVQALRRRDTMAFKAAMRACDVLLFDDLQFIAGKEATQDEFLAAFNALIDGGCRIVVACDRAPGDLAGVDPRLKSRLAGGLAARIDAPARATRLDILRARRAQMGRAVPDAILDLLADRALGSVRELEGALNRIIAVTDMTGAPLTAEAAADLVPDLVRAESPRIKVEEIQKAVAAHYGVELAALLSPARPRALARPRQIAMYLVKTTTDLSLPEIGRRFAGRDHTTILHGVRTISGLLERDADLAADVAQIRRALGL